jgi:hypothetical protein
MRPPLDVTSESKLTVFKNTVYHIAAVLGADSLRVEHLLTAEEMKDLRAAAYLLIKFSDLRS